MPGRRRSSSWSARTASTNAWPATLRNSSPRRSLTRSRSPGRDGRGEHGRGRRRRDALAVEALVAAADRALDRAKNRGGARVVLSDGRPHRRRRPLLRASLACDLTADELAAAYSVGDVCGGGIRDVRAEYRRTEEPDELHEHLAAAARRHATSVGGRAEMPAILGCQRRPVGVACVIASTRCSLRRSAFPHRVRVDAARPSCIAQLGRSTAGGAADHGRVIAAPEWVRRAGGSSAQLSMKDDAARRRRSTVTPKTSGRL